jgi:hypothetical protein
LSLIFDSAPDVSHADEISSIVRYIDKENQIEECFIHIEKHVGSYLESIISTLAEYGLDIPNRRVQFYDKVANMSGIYNGLEGKIKSHSENPLFIPCAPHNLNLVGNSAAESCLEKNHVFTSFKIYLYFLSTKRRDLLKKRKLRNKYNIKKNQ